MYRHTIFRVNALSPRHAKTQQSQGLANKTPWVPLPGSTAEEVATHEGHLGVVAALKAVAVAE